MTHEDKINNIMKELKKRIKVVDIIDVGPGAEYWFVVKGGFEPTREEFDEALARLIEEGYSYVETPIKDILTKEEYNLQLLSTPGKDAEWYERYFSGPSKTLKHRFITVIEKRRDSIDKIDKIKELVAKGLTNKEIADEIGIGESTVRNLRKIFNVING